MIVVKMVMVVMMVISVTVFVSLILALVFSSHLEDVRFATSSDTYALNCHRKPEHIEL